MKNYTIGIDLHGTLLDDDWEIKDEIKPRLTRALENKNVFVCTGNDLSFIRKYIPKDLISKFKGFVLETGCVFSDGRTEESIVGKSLVAKIKELETILKNKSYSQVLYFARRLASISLFTKSETEGVPPDEFYKVVKEFVDQSKYRDDVLVTHSNVAVDILPRGYNKQTGMEHVANGNKIIGIADSLNDFYMIAGGVNGFIPRDASDKLLAKLSEADREILNIKNAQLLEGEIIQSNNRNTKFVVESLEFIEKQ